MTTKPKAKFSVRKYDGDDLYSYAVFRSEDIKGKRGIIMYGEARPLYAGCGRQEAQHYKIQLEKAAAEKG